MARRDALDQGRDTAPLMRADGALELDTSDMMVDEIVDDLAGRIGDDD
jgi:CMP/dCMP kinase